MSFRLGLSWAGVKPNDYQGQQDILKADKKRFDDIGESAQARFRRRMKEARGEDYGEISRSALDFK